MDEEEQSKYYGRLVPVNLTQISDEKIEYLDAVQVRQGQVRCNRCGGLTPIREGQLPEGHYYCRRCINLGRISTLVKLGTIKEPNLFAVKPNYLEWQGQLTAHQKECSQDLIDAIDTHQDCLLWAVTGAGKTEMLFEGINHALCQGKRIGIASPRIDVVLELFPRLQAAFPEVEIALLHGRSTEPYRYTQFVLCTTHQLLRFYHGLDVLIIDEVDSFPYAMNKELHYAACQARKPKGSTIYLTATPDGALLRDSKSKKIKTSYLTKRFHGHPLPEIKVFCNRSWIKKITKKHMPLMLKKFIEQQIQEQHQFLVFVPKIEILPAISEVVQKTFPQLKTKTVHAADPERIEKVQRMRDQELDGLITTTILERGVTFPGIDVIVLGADDDVFSMASLVQIAGRVGRSPKRPSGKVWFICQMLNKNVKRAQRQIKFMNKKAGY